MIIAELESNVGAVDIGLSHPAKLYWAENQWILDSLSLRSDSGGAVIQGLYATNDKFEVSLHLSNWNMGIPNYFLSDPTLLLGGDLDAQIHISQAASQLYTGGTLNVRDFRIGSEWVGDIGGNVRYNPGDEYGRATLQIRQEGNLAFGANAKYFPELDSIQGTAVFNNLSLKPISVFLVDVLEPFNGNLRGRLNLQGPLDRWRMDGKLYGENIAFSVPVVGADVVIPRMSLTSNENKIWADTTLGYNPVDSTIAVLWGGLKHDRFDDMVLDVHMHTDSLLGVNLKRDVDQYFYGRAYASGGMDLVGPLDQLSLKLDVETKEGTDFKIPLDNPKAIEPPKFLRFTSLDGRELDNDTLRNNAPREYFVSDMIIRATDDARLELVLDELLGDVITAYGNGNIRMKILEDESIELYGLYTIQSGNYLFTLQNIINKPFEVVPGGTLLWSGDLYEAEVNLDAKYTLKTDLSGFVTNSSYGGEKVDVDLIIHLDGRLMAPDISFSINLPNSPKSYQEELNRHIVSDDQMNYQAFSLLMLGSFYGQSGTTQQRFDIVGSVSSTTSEVLVSQFGNWLAAGLGDYVDVELDYTSGANPLDQIGQQTGDELNLGISKDFLNGRLKLVSSLDLPVGQNSTSTLLLGDTEVSYKITSDGRIVLRAFNRSNRNDPLQQSSGPYTQGVGIQYRKEFEEMGIRRWIKRSAPQ
jgi:hypothetical protein